VAEDNRLTGVLPEGLERSGRGHTRVSDQMLEVENLQVGVTVPGFSPREGNIG
jgi:hypothetical protein